MIGHVFLLLGPRCDMIAVAKSGTAGFAPIFSNHLHIMNLDLQTAYAYMDTIQDTSNCWLIDNVQNDDNLHLSCSSLHSKCKLFRMCNDASEILVFRKSQKGGNLLILHASDICMADAAIKLCMTQNFLFYCSQSTY